MFKKILVPLDGSANGEKILPWVRQYAQRERSLILPIQVIDPRGMTPRSYAMARNDAEHYLQGIVRQLNYYGAPARAIVKAGAPASVIASTADGGRCDLIAMTTRGGSKVARWLIGGTAEKVVRMSLVPVLLTRPQTPLSQQGRVRRIFVPLDGSARAEAILPWAEGLARMHKAYLVFLHVMPKPYPPKRSKYMMQYRALVDRMATVVDRMRHRGTQATFRTGEGDAAQTLLFAADRGPNLISMTTHGYGGINRWIMGSVAERVIHAAEVPVFIYKSFAPARLNVKLPELEWAGR